MIFNLLDDALKQLGAFYTTKEIRQQPTTWLETLAQIKNEKTSIKNFLETVLNEDDFDIVLTGAGTSEFVGNTLFPYLNKVNKHKVKSTGTTDIVAAPWLYLDSKRPTLLVSFARSGNSPESVKAVEVANIECSNIKHLFVTCNADGALSKYAVGKDNCYGLNLSEKTHDQSFAMTSSYSNMLLATLLCLDLDNIDEYEVLIKEISANSENFFNGENIEIIENLVEEFDFQRIVYLGSNCLKGVAQESALKMCELTRGNVMTTFDSTMGFRHGPKSVISSDSLVVVYLSDDPYTRKYDLDIVKEIYSDKQGNKLVVLSSFDDLEARKYCDLFISFDNKVKMDNAFLALEYICVSQSIALKKSIKMNIAPDNPCPSGTVNRVVQGVILYPYLKGEDQ